MEPTAWKEEPVVLNGVFKAGRNGDAVEISRNLQPKCRVDECSFSFSLSSEMQISFDEYGDLELLIDFIILFYNHHLLFYFFVFVKVMKTPLQVKNLTIPVSVFVFEC